MQMPSETVEQVGDPVVEFDEGTGLQDEIGEVQSSLENTQRECRGHIEDCAHTVDGGHQCECDSDCRRILDEAITDACRELGRIGETYQEIMVRAQVTEEEAEDANAYYQAHALNEIAEDIRRLVSWGCEKGADVLEARLRVESPELREIIRWVDLHDNIPRLHNIPRLLDNIIHLDEAGGNSAAGPAVSGPAGTPPPPAAEPPVSSTHMHDTTPAAAEAGGGSGVVGDTAASEGASGESVSVDPSSHVDEVAVGKGATDPPPAAPSLAAFTQELRDYQQDVVDEAWRHAHAAEELPDDAPEAKRRILFSAPTGTGKGTIELALLKSLRGEPSDPVDGRNAWIYTPSLEVLRGFLERCGASAEALAGASADKLAELGEQIFVTTPTRHRNRVLSGDAEVPDVIIYDEVHHATEGNEVSGTLFALAPLSVWIGFTATPYRGTPKGTLELSTAWPDQVEVLTIPEAVSQGWWALPRFEVVGLVDDDKVRMNGGEFAVKASGNALQARQDDLAREVHDRFLNVVERRGDFGDICVYQDVPRLPTAIVTPSQHAAASMVEALDRVGIDAIMVVGTTKTRDRAKAYAACKACEVVLVVCEVLAEGWDAPWLRRMFDCSPTMSPVKWLQRLGRITRPGDVRPEVIVCCRNLERHAYLLGGLIPRQVIAQAQEEFEKPSKRSGYRSIGFEALRRFKAIDLPLSDGVRGTMFALYNADPDGAVTEWAVLLDPTGDESVVAQRVSHRLETMRDKLLPNGVTIQVPNTDWGKWQHVDQCPADLTGFATSQARGQPTQKQQDWWTRAARGLGLDPDAKISRRQFAALPILKQLGRGMIQTTTP